MLFMVVEHFKNGDAAPVYRRFREQGRLAPPGLNYIGSWVTQDLTSCYQVMECEDRALLDTWMSRWADLVDFEVTPVLTSADAASLVAAQPEMTPEALIELLQLFESAGIETWLDGGWAVDALLGAQTRPHKDVDIILRVSDLRGLREILGSRGFEIQGGGTESNFVLADSSGLEVDVHAIVFDGDGNGVYRMENGSDWIFPVAGFSGRGIVQGIGVRCLSPETQVLCHAQGYVPTEKDLRDMELLQARFGIELPPHLRHDKIAG